MKAKNICICMALAISFSFTGCAETSTAGTTEPISVSSGEMPDNETTISAATTDNKADTTTSAASAQEVTVPTEDDTAVSANKATIAEAVIFDDAGIKITAKGFDHDSFMGPKLKLLIENDSGTDKIIQCRNFSVNGYMIETTMSANVANGKKANDGITILTNSLEKSGITEIADMEFSFHIVESDDFSSYYGTELIQIRTSIADTYEYRFDDSGTPVYEKDGIRIVIKGRGEDQAFGPSVTMYTENNSGRDIIVQTDDSSVNGFMIDTVCSSEVTAGKHAVDAITFYRSQLEENDITDIQDVELSFRIVDAHDLGSVIKTDPVSFSVGN